MQVMDWNRTSTAKLLGTAVIEADALKRRTAGCGTEKAFCSDEFVITAPDGQPLMGQDQQQAHLLLKVAGIQALFEGSVKALLRLY